MTGPILPGATLGVLGGGQLGAMCTMAARRLGYRVAVWDPDPDAPAHTLANLSFKGPFADHVLLKQFEREVSAVTYEWENIPIAVLDVTRANRAFDRYLEGDRRIVGRQPARRQREYGTPRRCARQ